MLIIGTTIYVVTGALITGALLTDKRTNTNSKEASYCIFTGVFWPLAVPTICGILLFMNVKESINEKRNAKAAQLHEFADLLHKIGLIGGLTKVYVNANLAKRYK